MNALLAAAQQHDSVAEAVEVLGLFALVAWMCWLKWRR